MRNVLSKSTDSKTRTIRVENDLIIYKRKRDGVEDYLTYNETLYEILQLDRLIPFRAQGRLEFTVNDRGSKTYFYIYDLAYACYTGKVKVDSFLDDLQQYFDDKTMQGLTIDHADNNVHNNTALNLSLMDAELNSRKGGIVARIKEPTYLNSIYCDGKYRVQMMTAVNAERMFPIFERFGAETLVCPGMYAGIHFVCNNADDYVNCLIWLIEQRFEWAEPLRVDHTWIKNDNDCWCADIKNSLHAQRKLARMPIEQFQIPPFVRRTDGAN